MDATTIVPISPDLLKCEPLSHLVALRQMPDWQFIDQYGGTLRKAHRLGVDITKHLLVKRIEFEFGDAWECAALSRVTDKPFRSEDGVFPHTEALWHADRMAKINSFPCDKYTVRFINVTDSENNSRQGLALVLTETSATFIPKGSLVFALLSEFDAKTKTWSPCKNPF